MITLTYPDGSTKDYESGVTGLEVAKAISEGLAREAYGIRVNEGIVDLSRPIDHDAKIEILTFKQNDGVEIFRHSSAHLLAQAVMELFPEAKLTIGPVVEEGFYYDIDHPPFTSEDLEKMEVKMREIVDRRLPIIRHVYTKDEALHTFRENKYKTELISELDGEITAYQQGSFIDLCMGPHVQHTGQIKAFKILKIAGAYWRADAKNKQLQRIYGISFPDKKLLAEYIELQEQAKKRDHRLICKQLDLASFHEESPGAIFYHPKGTIIYNELQNFIRREYIKRDYKEVITPLVYDKSLWETSGHWQHYKDNMFCFEVDGKEVSLKSMNCPSHCLIFKTSSKSYRDLPLRIADFAMLHRNELKGVLGGMTRVRKFSQDDAHIFCTQEQLASELNDVIDFVKYVYDTTFHFEYHVELSTKPEKSMGDSKQWEIAEDTLKVAIEKNNLKCKINPGDGAFYGPKIDIHIKDALGRSWQLATIQLDFQMPGRFGLEYEGGDGIRHTPIMIHRAIFGAFDRFIGILIEQYAGKFPLWLSPVQVRLLPIADRHIEYCKSIATTMKEEGLRVEIDEHAETTPKKVRNAQLDQVNYMLIIGDREVENQSVNVRMREGTVLGEKNVEEFTKELLQEIKERK